MTQRSNTQKHHKISYVVMVKNWRTDQQIAQTKHGLTFEHLDFRKEDNKHFWLKGIRPKRLQLSQQITSAISCNEWARKEKSIQWESPTDQTRHIYTPSLFDQWQYRKRVSNFLFKTCWILIRKVRSTEVDYHKLAQNKIMLCVTKIEFTLFKRVTNCL